MKKTTETVTYTCDWCGEEFDPSKQENPIVLKRKFYGNDVTNDLTIRPIVYIYGDPSYDVCDKCINAGILEYAEGLKKCLRK